MTADPNVQTWISIVWIVFCIALVSALAWYASCDDYKGPAPHDYEDDPDDLDDPCDGTRGV